MKQVIITKYMFPTRDVDTANTNNCYGVICPTGTKGFVARTQYDVGDFRIHLTDFLTNGNGVSFKSPHLSVLLTYVLELGYKVYEFGSPGKLFAWLAEK